MNSMMKEYEAALEEERVARAKLNDTIYALKWRCNHILKLTRNVNLGQDMFQIQKNGIFCDEYPHIPGDSCPTIPYEQLDMSDAELTEIGRAYQKALIDKAVLRKKEEITRLQKSIASLEASTQE